MTARKIIRTALLPLLNIKKYGIYNLSNIALEKKYKAEIDIIHKFYSEYPDFRLVETCSEVTKIDIKLCKRIKEYLYSNRIIGNYFFEKDAFPHKYMKDFILSNFPAINNQAFILEVGPGNNPIFKFNDYQNWYGVDKFFDVDRINFRSLNWAVNKYPNERICKGSWETLGNSVNDLNINSDFDLLVSSHSYEHCFKPIASLIEASKVLKKDGIIVLFVPDGFSDHSSARDEMTHTLFLVPEMIKEFFDYSDVFYDLQIKTFRPNADYVITAKKK